MPLRALAIIEKHFLTTPLAWHCNRQIAFGMLPDGIGYLLMNSFENYDKNADSGAQTAALDAALDEIFATAGDLKGLVIDIYIRVSLVGIEILTVDARIVIASVDTYLRFAEAVNRLDLTETQTSGPELMEDVVEGITSRG